MKLERSAFAMIVIWRVALVAQTSFAPSDGEPHVTIAPSKTCREPQSVIGWGDYRGPMQSLVNLAHKLERTSDSKPVYKPGAALCSPGLRDRFVSFVKDTADPISLMSSGFSAGLNHASHRDPSFRLGSAGYARRFGAEIAGQTAWRFFVDFGYPTLFSEDPRYYRLGEGPPAKRFLHAAKHVFIASHESGRSMFNYSEWLGTASAVALSDTYHPGNRRGITPMAQRVSLIVVQDMGQDTLKEFWPDLVHKLHLPFRDMRDPSAPEAHR